MIAHLLRLLLKTLTLKIEYCALNAAHYLGSESLCPTTFSFTTAVLEVLLYTLARSITNADAPINPACSPVSEKMISVLLMSLGMQY